MKLSWKYLEYALAQGLTGANPCDSHIFHLSMVKVVNRHEFTDTTCFFPSF